MSNPSTPSDSPLTPQSPKSVRASSSISEMDLRDTNTAEWLTAIMKENPKILALRERTLPWSSGYSFSQAVHTSSTIAISHINRFKVLELIYQHLRAIGMNKTAEQIAKETGLNFQEADSSWYKTDLSVLVSLGVLAREDQWNIPPDDSIQYIDEVLEEDSYASPYTEDPELIYKEYFDPDYNVVFNGERTFKNLKAASLRRFVVMMVKSEEKSKTPFMSDNDNPSFFLSLHYLTSACHFLEHLFALFNLDFGAYMPDATCEEVESERSKAQLGIVNLIRKWINFHGLFIGRRAIKKIEKFFTQLSTTESNLTKFAESALRYLKRIGFGTKKGDLGSPKDPDIPDFQILFSPTLTILDPSPLEVARQITLLQHKAFAAVHSRELIYALNYHEASYQTPTLIEFFDFGDRLTRLSQFLISENPVPETVMKIIKIANELIEIGNFDASRCLITSIRSFSIRDSDLSAKVDALEENFNENYKFDVRFDQWRYTIPDVRAEILSFKMSDQPQLIDGLINWEKIANIAEKTQKLYRFQNKECNFHSIPQIQKAILRTVPVSESVVLERVRTLVI